jgi:2-C-methyl-D-erythritol 4-phosphate cytidylyltransferase
MASTHAVVVAAGSGERFGGDTPKQLALLAGTPIVVWAVRPFLDAGCASVVVVTRDDLLVEVGSLFAGEARVKVVPGGATRASSTHNGLAALAAEDDDVVLVHDAARPLIDTATIAACRDAVLAHGAATVALAVGDTILVTAGGTVTAVPDRASYRRAQTPQGFRYAGLVAAHEAAHDDDGAAITDECGVVLRHRPDVAIAIVPGSERLMKITTRKDLEIAERLLADSPPL